MTSNKKQSGFWTRMSKAIGSIFVPSKIIMYLIGIAAIVVATVLITRKCMSEKEPADEGLVIEETPILIEDIRPKGELYVYNMAVEDYTTEQRTSMFLGIIPQKHTCVQMLKQSISYKIDLDKVKYTPDSANVVFVELPEVEYVASTQDSPFVSDDEEYWKTAMPNTNAMKSRVERQIKRKYDTPATRELARKNAQIKITVLLRKLGVEPRFTGSITKNDEAGKIGK